ncbi:hypothetical protein J4G37_51765, partial [Microvirga sp. 3-52]|nr:hypothetical protein [Microvirga sp. 3-52]
LLRNGSSCRVSAVSLIPLESPPCTPIQSTNSIYKVIYVALFYLILSAELLEHQIFIQVEGLDLQAKTFKCKQTRDNYSKQISAYS